MEYTFDGEADSAINNERDAYNLSWSPAFFGMYFGRPQTNNSYHNLKEIFENAKLYVDHVKSQKYMLC